MSQIMMSYKALMTPLERQQTLPSSMARSTMLETGHNGPKRAIMRLNDSRKYAYQNPMFTQGLRPLLTDVLFAAYLTKHAETPRAKIARRLWLRLRRMESGAREAHIGLNQRWDLLLADGGSFEPASGKPVQSIRGEG